MASLSPTPVRSRRKQRSLTSLCLCSVWSRTPNSFSPSPPRWVCVCACMCALTQITTCKIKLGTKHWLLYSQLKTITLTLCAPVAVLLTASPAVYFLVSIHEHPVCNTMIANEDRLGNIKLCLVEVGTINYWRDNLTSFHLMCVHTQFVCFFFFLFQAGLPGFYDPCVGEEKSLKLLYQFRGVMHQVISADTDPLRIPKQC